MDVRRKAGINNDGWAGGERVLALIPREAILMEKGEAAAHEPKEPFMSHCPRPW
jgi:hypothetical protein